MVKRASVMALDVGPEADLDPEMQAYLAKCVEKLGFVPNVLQAYAFDNAKLKAFVAMADDLMLADSGLSKLEREMIAVAVSSVNHCHYCLTAHGAAVRQRAKDPEMGELIAQNYRAADLTPRQKAMLDFAVRLTEAPDKVEEADREGLRGAGAPEPAPSEELPAGLETATWSLPHSPGTSPRPAGRAHWPGSSGTQSGGLRMDQCGACAIP